MTCAEADAFIQAYIDGELAGVDREGLERHFVSCSGCARRARLESRFKAAVRAHLPRPQVPAELTQRLQAALTSQPIAPRRWTMPAWFSYSRMVPAAAAVLVLIGITATVRHRQSMVLEQAERSYHRELPMDVTDCASIASWFRGRVDFPVRAPTLGGGAKCQGGRLVDVGERSAAYIVYRVHDGHRVAFLVFDPRDERFEGTQRRVANGREITLVTGPGTSTAAFRDRGLGYVATSDLDQDSLAQLVLTSFQP
jgi:anti-sigma factor (TIGR02949 family)